MSEGLGREFQRESAATEEALSPQVRGLVLGVLSVFGSVDRRQSVEVWWRRRSRMLGVARLFMMLKVVTSIGNESQM